MVVRLDLLGVHLVIGFDFTLDRTVCYIGADATFNINKYVLSNRARHRIEQAGKCPT